MEHLTQNETENQAIKKRARIRNNTEIRKDRKTKHFLIKDRGEFNSGQNGKHSWLSELCSLTYNYSGNCHTQVLSLRDRTIFVTMYKLNAHSNMKPGIHRLIHKSLIKRKVSAHKPLLMGLG